MFSVQIGTNPCTVLTSLSAVLKAMSINIIMNPANGCTNFLGIIGKFLSEYLSLHLKTGFYSVK